jgi:hypothetical protein
MATLGEPQTSLCGFLMVKLPIPLDGKTAMTQFSFWFYGYYFWILTGSG